jgi:hypothetical protein
MTQLIPLSEPFPKEFIKKPPAGKFGEYVPHSTVTERLLAIVGPFSTNVVREIYNGDTLTGVVLRLTVTIDGEYVSIEEAGDAENPGGRKSNGALLKDATSDAIKRCAMRLGLGLHLWSQEDYFLHNYLKGQSDE